MVMPDIVGDQRASLELIRTHARRIAVDVKSSKNIPIIPLQKGELSLRQAFDEVAAAIGTRDFVVGIPSNEAALSAAELREFLVASRPTALHFLGAASEKTLGPKLDAVNEAMHARPGYEPTVTADANLLRSKLYGRSMEAEGGRYGAIIETLTKEDGCRGSRNACSASRSRAPRTPSLPGILQEAQAAGKMEGITSAIDEAVAAEDHFNEVYGDQSEVRSRSAHGPLRSSPNTSAIGT